MDILRKELDGIYSAQRLGEENLPPGDVETVKKMAEGVVMVKNGCAVVTDASCDRCHVYPGAFGGLMGFADSRHVLEFDSSDEDLIYNLIHPEDLVDKRFLEYEFFMLADSVTPDDKLSYRATCRLRMKDPEGKYRYVDNSTQVIRLSPAGKIWLILCLYDLSSNQNAESGISPCIVNAKSGEIKALSFDAKRSRLLSEREKEILLLIKDGKPSKQIADILGISVHTVNRHRQNIIAKLSVGNSIEAITAASAMKLL